MWMVNKLRTVFNIRNRFLIPDKLFDFIKFEVNHCDKKNTSNKTKSISTNIDKKLNNLKTIILFIFILIFFTIIIHLFLYGLLIQDRNN
jgi:hypothetical protein